MACFTSIARCRYIPERMSHHFYLLALYQSLSSRQFSLHLRPGIFAHIAELDISKSIVTPLDLLLCLLKITANALRTPLIHVAYPPAARHEKLAALLPYFMERSKHGFNILAALDALICKHFRHDSSVFNAQACAGAMMRRCRVRGITNDGNAAFGIGGRGMVQKIENSPLEYVSKVMRSSPRRSGYSRYPDSHSSVSKVPSRRYCNLQSL